jgi:DNA repair protein RadD
MELRPYQEQSIQQLRTEVRNGYSKIGLMLPTGAGKTLIAATLIQNALEKGKRVGFICDRIDLIDQTSAAFDAMGIDHGVIQADHWRTDYAKKVQVCSIQTLGRRRVPEFDLFIVDEFHTMYKPQLDIMKKHDAIYIGLSATPFSKGLGLHWEKLVVGSTTKSLIKDGYLSDFVVYGPPPPDLKGVKVQMGDYNQRQLAERVDQSAPIGDVVRTWLKYGEHRQTIIFAVNIAHSKHIAQEFQNNGISAYHIDAYTDSDERRQLIKAYKEGTVKVLICVDILTKGFDAPETGTLVMARPTKSLIVHLQQIGRVLRIAPGKENAIILDHGGNVSRHGFPTDDVIPTDMNMDIRQQSERSEKTVEKLPHACPSCHLMMEPDVWVCPNCGFKPEKRNNVVHGDGELVKLNKYTKEDKQRWYSMLLGHCRSKGYADGWAAHKYRDKIGVWPKGLDRTPLTPEGDVKGYITHLNIKHARRKT